MCTSAKVSAPSCTPLEDTNTIPMEPQIPIRGIAWLNKQELQQESWFLKALKEYYDKLNLKEFTAEMVQCELFKNFWGNPFSERQIQHLCSLNKYPRHSVINILQPAGQEEIPVKNWSGPAEGPECPVFTPYGTKAGHGIPLTEDWNAGQRIRQAGQKLNTVSNLSPHKLRKIDCWVETGQYGLI